MRKINRYRVGFRKVQRISMPLTHKILTVGYQDHDIYVHVLEEEDESGISIDREFRVYEEGEVIKDNIDEYEYLGVFKLSQRTLHIFTESI